VNTQEDALPVIFQYRIYRSDLVANPNALYLFGDNNMRKGMGGQAGEMRGMENACGVRTKWRPDMQPNSFFTDADLEIFKLMMVVDLDEPFKAIKRGKVVVIPSDGLGTGLSELPTRAPTLYACLNGMISQLVELDKTVDLVFKQMELNT
jgi:hypothetical protein